MSVLRAFRETPARTGCISIARVALGLPLGLGGGNASSGPLHSTGAVAGDSMAGTAANAQPVGAPPEPCRAHSLLQQARMITSSRPSWCDRFRGGDLKPFEEGEQASPTAAHDTDQECRPAHVKDARPIDELVGEVFKCAAYKSHAQHESPLQALAECLVSRAHELNSKQIRDLTVEFAKLHFFDTEFRNAISRAMKDRLHEFEPHHVADTAYAFAEAGYYDYELFMKVLVPHLRNHASLYDASSLAKLLSAFTRFGLNDDVLIELMDEVTVKLNSAEGSKAIAEVVFAEARMGWADERVQSVAAYYATEHIQDFDAETVSKLMYGLIALGYEDEAVLALLVGRAKEVADHLSPEDVTRMMWAVGELGYYDEPFLNTMVELVAKDPEAYNAAQLSSIVTASNKLGYNSPGLATAARHLGQAQGMPVFAM